MAWKHKRESRHARGYGSLWDKIRAQVLLEEPLCRMCKQQDRTTAATNVDHILPKAKGGTDDRENLQPLCDDCAEIKLAMDKGRRIKGCNPDGSPRDPRHHWYRST